MIPNRIGRSPIFFPLDEVAGKAKLSWRCVVEFVPLSFLLSDSIFAVFPSSLYWQTYVFTFIVSCVEIVWRTSANWRPDQERCGRGTQGECICMYAFGIILVCIQVTWRLFVWLTYRNMIFLPILSNFCLFNQVKHIEGKGRGVFADRAFQRGQFVVEYHGELLEIKDAKEKESQYAQDPTTGCYMFYFRYLDKSYWWGSSLCYLV